MKTTKTKIDVFTGMLSMEFDGGVVNYKINYVGISDNVYVNLMGTSRPLPEDSYEFSDDFVQYLFLDRNVMMHQRSRNKISLGMKEDMISAEGSEKKLTEKDKLGEEEEKVNSEKKLKRKKKLRKMRRFLERKSEKERESKS